MFTSILTGVEGSLTVQNAVLCMAVSLLLGILISAAYGIQGTCSKNFMVTLVLLPVLVQMIIMLVNGNLGTSVAVLGAFSLVRFRSVPGSSKEMAVIFFAMAAGLATGMGFLSFAVLMTAIIGGVFLLLEKTRFGESKRERKDLRVTIAEHLDYTEIFDDIFRQYTDQCDLQRVKTTNLGSMYELEYHIVLKDLRREKEMLDAIRCRNGNLTVICGRRAAIQEEL
ncbi:hypothetical protein C817_02495 [Dorea sp. 5-2]|nr:hypothetical protein C817_02495 [Dorea sp. 5-2]